MQRYEARFIEKSIGKKLRLIMHMNIQSDHSKFDYSNTG